MRELKVKNVIVGKQVEKSENLQAFIDIVNKKKIKVNVLGKTPINIQIEKDIYLDFLWPDSSNLIEENGLNNNSICFKLLYNDFLILFTGDIEEIAEMKLIEKYKEKISILNSTVLKTAHHGSKTSSTQEFLEAVKPKIALIGVKENNKFGHPNEEVLERLKKSGALILRTDKMGEIKITVDVNGRIKIKKLIE